MQALNVELTERVLQKLGLGAPPRVDHAGLTEVYGAWCRSVPFDNLRKLIAVRSGAPGPLPGDDPAEFLEAWLAHGVGGTCWAGNGALCALLETLGFSARRGVGTMLVAPDIPPNHGTVVVDVQGGRYVVDASILHVEPLPVVVGAEAAVGNAAWGVLGRWHADHYLIAWRPLHVENSIDCRIDEWAVASDRFRRQHEATRDWSPFNFELTFNLVRGAGRVGLAAGKAVSIAADGTCAAADIADRVAYLVDELGVSAEIARRVPADVPTPPPPGSRTAGRRITDA